MSDIADTPAPAAATPSTPSADSLLTSLVQEHLVRTGAAATPAKDPPPDISTQRAAKAPKVDAADLDTLLSQDAQKIVDEESAGLAPPLVATGAGTMIEEESIRPEELARLISTNTAAEDPPADMGEGLSPTEVAQADPFATAQAIPQPDSDVPVAVALPVREPPMAQVIEPKTAQLVPPAKKGIIGWLLAIIHDVLLMIAQILDLPFTMLSQEVKQLLAVAGLILLASGAMLMVMVSIRH